MGVLDPDPHLGYAVEHLADRAAAYGFEGVVVDGTDVLAVYRETKAAIEKARNGGGPTLLELKTLRMEDTPVHDDAFYVPQGTLRGVGEERPGRALPHVAARERRADGEEEEEEISSRVKKLLNDALAQAEDSPQPDPATLLEGVYATPEDLDTPHHK